MPLGAGQDARETLQQSPGSFAERLLASGARRAWIARGEAAGELRASCDLVSGLSQLVRVDPAYRGHHAVFLEVEPETGLLLAAFVHDTRRGQAQGGVRYQAYPTLGGFLQDGLRLSLGMGRKCALAGLWWGGGKGVIARAPGDAWRDPGYRRAVFAGYGRFVSSLRGAYVTAEDAGTTPADMAEVHKHTRFATCVPPDIGGSGNPSAMTAAGVVVAMEAALAFRRTPGLAGRCVAMQGAGNVGAEMIGLLLARGVSRVVVAEASREQRDLVLDRFTAEPVTVRLAAPGDASILAEPCDVLAPNALGGVLDAKTIPEIRAAIVCGAANNPLADDSADATRLAERGITHVPDFIANRLGIVCCANEHAGSLPNDPAVTRHLNSSWPDSIPNVTRRVLEEAAGTGDTPIAVANALADARIEEPHPIWGRRAEEITDTLLRSGWVDA